MNNKKLIFILLFLICILTSCNGQGVEIIEESEKVLDIEYLDKEVDLVKVEKNVDFEKIEEFPEPKIETIRIKAFGDIMFHQPQTRYANNFDGSYDYSESFSDVKDFIRDSDLSIGNFETTSNPNREYSGFPTFNTPPSTLYYLKDAGFDVLSTMNNHTLDTGLEGIDTTLDAISSASLESFGTSKDGEEKFNLININNIKVGLLSYSYSLNGLESILDTEEKQSKVNLLNNEENIKADIEKLKDLGSDIILIYPHWGQEYQSHINDSQREMAHKMLEWGGDIIIGNHPHVVQPTENYITLDGRNCFIAYSCGNFISNQRRETLGSNIPNSKRSEQNIAYEIIIEKDFNNEESIIKEVIYHPMWVGLRQGNKDKLVVKSHLCTDFIEGGDKYEEVDSYTREKIINAYEEILITTQPIQ